MASRLPASTKHIRTMTLNTPHVTVLVPVSSTVIPLPVYKVGFGVGVDGTGKKAAKPDEATKLITGIV